MLNKKLMLSKTRIKSRIGNKTNPELIETIRLGMKNPAWIKLAQFLSNTSRDHSSVNLSRIDKIATPGDTIVVAGKVLSQGTLTKKVKICALSISNSAKDKLKDSKSEFTSIVNEIKKNPKGEGIKLIR
jgi:large subunit ribosomal protein L18e